MKCPHCGEELPEGYIYIPPETANDAHAPGKIDPDNMAAEDIQSSSGIEKIYAGNDTSENHTPDLEEEHELISPEQISNDQIVIYGKKKKTSSKLIIAVSASVVVLAVIIFAVYSLLKPSLEYDIRGEWVSGDDFISSSTLTITDDMITISETFGFMEISNASYSYTVTSSDTIEIRGTEFNVSVNGNALIISPGFNGDQQDIWYSGQPTEDDIQEQIPENQQSDSSGVI